MNASPTAASEAADEGAAPPEQPPISEAVLLLARRIIEEGYEDLPARERRVLELIAQRMAVSQDINLNFDKGRNFGERAADRIAAFGGSWTFILLFAVAITLWMLVNTLLFWRLGDTPFDPYPFILLNLFLSLVAAVQAPIIMMSQNRQAAKDRLQASHDYEVNLKAEIEIMALHEKMDELRQKDLRELIERLHKQR